VGLGARLLPVLSSHAQKTIPASHLFSSSEPIKGWEGTKNLNSLVIKPNALCGSKSSVDGGGFGWTVSLSTVGFPATFTILARDQYGNIRSGTASTTEKDFFVSRLMAVLQRLVVPE
jgi:hypothetical protein